MHEPFKSRFSDCYSLLGIVIASTVWFPEVEVLGLISQVHILKVGVLDMGFERFSIQGEAPGFGYLPDCGYCTGDGVYGEIVAQPLLSALVWTSSH